MIKQFDKGGIAAYFKRKFSDCIREYDYEGALDFLLKYRDERNNADFHLACGMLYLQLSLDSDDNELVSLAYRELMMHIARNPDCTEAYRDLLAALLLRRDGVAFVECCKWIKSRDIDFREVMSDLAECGALFISADDEPPDFDMLFDGEYGEIQHGEWEASADDVIDPPHKPAGAGSKVIAFGEKPTGENARRVNSVAAGKTDTYASERNTEAPEDVFSFDTETFGEEYSAPQSKGDVFEFGDFINAYLYGDEYDDNDADAVLDAADIEVREGGVREVPDHENDEIRLAEEAYDRGDVKAALDVLSTIKKSDERYYFALTMRALINIEYGQFGEAERILDEASAMKPHGALGGALLCQLYEAEGRTELIPSVLKNIDVKDYINAPHLYKSFDMALKYCDAETAAELLRSYIDEFNIMEMRLVYAQLMYNLGEREYAVGELYKLTRIFYDDINARLIYLTARSGVERFAVNTEAPQSVLAAIVENLLGIVLSGSLDDELVENDMFGYSIEFFLTLEYRNDKRLLVKMFDAVRILANYEKLETRARDALVSPYVEPIVKAVILGELLAAAPEKPFLAEHAYCAISSDCVQTLEGGLSAGYYIAYAFALFLCPERLDKLISLAKNTEFCDKELAEESKAFYLIRTACGADLKDERVPLALGFGSKSAATRDFKAVAAALNSKNTDKEKR